MLGRDGRVYISASQPVAYDHIIEQPNEPGLLSKINLRGLELMGISNHHVPNHPNYRLGPLEGSSCDTLGLEKTIYILAHPYPFEACTGGEGHFEVTAFGTGRSYQWQSSPDGGMTWENLTDGPHYSNVKTEYMQLHNIPADFDSLYFRCIVTGNISTEISRPALLTLTGQVPSSAFSYTQDKDSIFFHNMTTGELYTTWYFSDGDSSVLTNATHLFTQSGTFQSMLVATNSCGQDTSIQNITIEPLLAKLNASRTFGCAPMTVTFTSDVAYRVKNQKFLTPGSTAPVAWANNGIHTVTYNSPGTYDVTLMIFNGFERDTLVLEDYITVVAGTNPVANIQATQDDSNVQLHCPFNLADSYTWYFSTGDTLSGQSVEYDFTGSGLYEVILETANYCGAALDTAVFLVGAPEAAFTGGTQTGCAPFTVQFSNQTQFTGADYEWHFPGGQPAVSYEENPQVLYKNPGQFNVTLIASAGNVADTLTFNQYIEVLAEECPQPQVFIQTDGLQVMAWTDCQEVVTFSWDMGDGSAFLTQSVTHQYHAAGNYTIALVVSGICGSDTVSVPVVVENPLAGIDISQRKDLFSLQPNPASDHLEVTSAPSVNGPAVFKIFNQLGSCVLLVKKDNWPARTVVDVSTLPAGIYFFEIEWLGNRVHIGKFMIAR